MDFIEMWQEADLIDAEIGGIDSIPEEEQCDYQMGLLIRLADDFKHGKEMKERKMLGIVRGQFKEDT